MFCFEISNVVVFLGDIGNDGDFVVNWFNKGFDNFDLFFWGEEGIFIGVIENDEIFDIFDGGKLRFNMLDSFVVDWVVFVEWSDLEGVRILFKV